MAGHFVGPDCTSGEVPAIHAGINTKVASYTHPKTASGSTTIAICAIPGGAVVTDVTVAIGTNDLDTTGGASVSTQGWIAGAAVAEYITTQSGSLQVQRWAPTAASVGLRLTSSANLVIALTDAVGTGTASIAFTVVLQYTADQDPD